MKTDFIKNEDLTAEIKVTIEPADYSGKLDSELKKLQQTSNMRGFRKGKTPKSFLLKTHGKALLLDIINEKLGEGLNEFLDKSDENIIGRPLPSESQETIPLDPAKEKEYIFKFDLGWHADIEIVGLNDPFHYYDIGIDDETLQKNLDQLREQDGKREGVTEDFEENDLVSFNAQEMEGDKVKKNGLETTFDVLIKDIPDEEIKKKVLGSKVGDKLIFDIYKISENPDESFVRKYLMNLEEEDEDLEVNAEFEAEVVNVQRLFPAEMTEEFFGKYFGEEVTSEEEALEMIRKELKQSYDRQADQFLHEEVQERIIERTEIALPDEFMKRWLLDNASEEDDVEITEEEMEEEYTTHLRDKVRWQMIWESWVRKYEVEVKPEEVVGLIRRQVLQFLPPQNLSEGIVEDFVKRVLEDKEQVQRYHQQVATDKMFSRIKEDLTLDKEPISIDDFLEIVDEKNQKLREEQEAAETELTQEEE